MYFPVRPVSIVLFCLSLSVLRAQLGPQIPLPHRHKSPSQQSSSQGPSIEAQGIVRSNDGKTIAVDSDDGRTFTLNLNDKTTYSRSGNTIPASTILQGATIHFEATADDQDNLTAVKVDLLKDPPRQSANASNAQAEGSPPEDNEPRATILQSPVDAPNRPVLHHGASHQQTSSSDSNSTQASSGGSSNVSTASNRPVYKDDDITVEPDSAPASAPAKPKSEDLVERAREWVGSFTESLPNYVCQQSTTRYVEQSRQSGWQALDLVTAQVVYEDGKESYRDITVGGRKTNKSMMELGGSTSTGEFASTLRGVFAPQSEAKFKFAQTARAGGSEAALYDFRVDLHHSDWQIRVGGQTLRPAYSGTVWIDKNTAQVRRIEMQADNVPPDFPLDTVEWAVDYDKVMLGTGSFFLPVHAENLGCQRGSSICSKNAIDFRNYHKFSGESTIKFGQ
ncbi:MAG: hypothetical protein WB676_29405 [Bryobacteraceae bacterium]